MPTLFALAPALPASYAVGTNPFRGRRAQLLAMLVTTPSENRSILDLYARRRRREGLMRPRAQSRL